MSRPLRILMVTPRSPLEAGGVQRYVWELSSRLIDRDVHVEVLCSDPGGHHAGVLERDGLRIRTLRAWPAERDWCFAPGLWRAIEPRVWDLIHVQSYHTLVAPMAMARAIRVGTPFCVTFHGGGHSSRIRHRARGVQWRALRPLLTRAAALVAVARFEIDVYSRVLRVPRERFRLIPNGTDLPSAPPPIADTSAEGSLLASIGRLERYKGHQRVIAALPYVLGARPEARLLVVGTGPYEPELRRQAAELGLAEQIAFTSVPPGDHGAMSALLSRVSLVVLMSEYETHPLVALEAAAARRRLLVADDQAGLRELGQDGFARLLPLASPPPDVGAAILEELVKPPPTAMPRLATWDECADQQLALYRELVGSEGTDNPEQHNRPTPSARA
jgi:glycogen synthase